MPKFVAWGFVVIAVLIFSKLLGNLAANLALDYAVEIVAFVNSERFSEVLLALSFIAGGLLWGIINGGQNHG